MANAIATVPQLAKRIKALIDKGDHAADKAEQFYKAAGLELQKLKDDFKDNKPPGVTWEQYVYETCGLRRSRADELIRIGEGSTTLEEVRKRDSEKKRRLRHKPPGRPGAPPPDEPEDNPEPEDAPEDEPDDDRMHYMAYMNRVNEAIKYAFHSGPITDDAAALARAAADAWNKLAQQLETNRSLK